MQNFFTGARAQVKSYLTGERIDDMDVSRWDGSHRVFVVNDFCTRQIPFNTTTRGYEIWNVNSS